MLSVTKSMEVPERYQDLQMYLGYLAGYWTDPGEASRRDNDPTEPAGSGASVTSRRATRPRPVSTCPSSPTTGVRLVAPGRHRRGGVRAVPRQRDGRRRLRRPDRAGSPHLRVRRGRPRIPLTKSRAETGRTRACTAQVATTGAVTGMDEICSPGRACSRAIGAVCGNHRAENACADRPGADSRSPRFAPDAGSCGYGVGGPPAIALAVR